MRLPVGLVWLALFLAGLGTRVGAAPNETWTDPTSGIVFTRIPGGCFRMGLPQEAFSETGGVFRQRIRNEMPEHEVCLDEFWIGRIEVRHGDWRRVMGSDGTEGEDVLPLAGISWSDANRFAQKLSEKSNGAERFRLPTEAEWEYACRAGAKVAPRTLRTRGELDRVAWYSSNYDLEPTGVRFHHLQVGGTKRANAFGLYDMLGNAWEWVADAYLADAYRKHELYNPVERSAADNVKRVIRGGGLRTGLELVRCETRAWLYDREPTDTVGFRLVRERRR